MADEMEVSVGIHAVDETAAGLDSAEESVEEFADKAEASFERVAERLAEYFAVERIAEFVKGSVEEFAKIQRAMETLAIQVRLNGESWDKNKANVEAFIDSEERLYGVTRSDLIQGLTEAETVTHNLALSLKVTDYAARLAAVGIGSFHENVESVGRAVEGNRRGLMELGNELGLVVTRTGDVGEMSKRVFGALEQAVSKVNQVEGDSQSTLNALETAWEDFELNVGEVLTPLLKGVAILLDVVRTGWDHVTLAARMTVDVLEAALRLVVSIGEAGVDAFEALKDAAEGNFHAAATRFKEIGTDFTEGFKQDVDEANKDWDSFAADLVATWGKANDKVRMISDATLNALAEKNAEAANALLGGGKKKGSKSGSGESAADIQEAEAAQQLQVWDEYNEKRLASVRTLEENVEALHQAYLTAAAQADAVYAANKGKTDAASEAKVQGAYDARLAAYKKLIEAQEKLDEQQQRELEAGFKTAYENIQNVSKAFFTMLQESHKSAQKAEEDFWKSILKMGVTAITKILQAQADSYLAQGTAQLASSYGTTGYQDLAAGAAIEALIGGINGLATAALATGGVVTSPTLALVGEREPEAVVPLSRAASYGFGGGGPTTHNHTWNFPGVTNATEAKRSGESAGLEFARVQMNTEARRGNRGFRS